MQRRQETAPGRGRRSRIVNVATVPQRSILRYPGGKTWMIPEIRRMLRRMDADTMVEPFAGGGVVSLTAVAEGYVDRAVMAEMDGNVAALWRTAIHDHRWLVDRIRGFEITRKNVTDLMRADDDGDRMTAFQTIIRNRTNYGGILARGASMVRSGEDGRGLASRWYPETLCRRIAEIAGMGDRLKIIEGDGMSVIRRYRGRAGTVFFVDPPYTAAGKRAGRRLYDHNTVDHEALFGMSSGIRGNLIMTYDYSDEVVGMARRHGLTASTIRMKNGHHAKMTELVITNG